MIQKERALELSRLEHALVELGALGHLGGHVRDGHHLDPHAPENILEVDGPALAADVMIELQAVSVGIDVPAGHEGGEVAARDGQFSGEVFRRVHDLETRTREHTHQLIGLLLRNHADCAVIPERGGDEHVTHDGLP